MRLAVFTSQFPSKVSTFFARDIRALIDAGIEIDIFPIYPLDARLWKYVPDILPENIFHRSNVHYVSLADTFYAMKSLPRKAVIIFLRKLASVSFSAIKFGFIPFAKSIYVFAKALAWTKQYGNKYDHILSYWGNYAATCAYVSHLLIDKPIPFSIFLHAGTDLYRDQVYLKQKLLYADNIITCSEFNRKFIWDLYPDIFKIISHKIHVYHHGIDFKEFQFVADGRLQRKILAVGRLEKQKGFDYLLQAMKKLQLAGIDAELELIGDGEDANSLISMANKLKIEKKVKFRGWLTFKEVQAAMKQATILVHPSSGIGDGVPNVIKEAMAFGTPVIASNVAGIPELLNGGECGILVPDRNAGALSEAIKTLLTDNVLRRRFAYAGREYVEKTFDLWHNGNNLADVLRCTKRIEKCVKDII